MWKNGDVRGRESVLRISAKNEAIFGLHHDVAGKVEAGLPFTSSKEARLTVSKLDNVVLVSENAVGAFFAFYAVDWESMSEFGGVKGVVYF